MVVKPVISPEDKRPEQQQQKTLDENLYKQLRLQDIQ